MDLTALKYFVATAESKNFTRAAEVCNVSQPALSRKIRKLEEEYGLRLIERSTHSVELTKEGELCYRYAKRALGACALFDKSMSELAGGSGCSLRIDYTTLGDAQYLNRLSAQQGATGPLSELKIQSQKAKPLICMENLARGETDAVLINLPMVAGEQGLEWGTIKKSGLCAFLPAASPHARQGSIRLSELVDYPIVTFPRECGAGTYDALMKMLRQSGVDLRIAAYSTDTYSFRVLIEVEGYIGLMFSTSKEIMESETIRCLPIPELGEGFDLVLAWKRNSRKRDLLLAIREAMETIQEGP
jgi:DNA-binding transcriptional LysR family regulator